jgi:hypothetical protein
MKSFFATACLISLTACTGTAPLAPAPSAFPSVSDANAAKFNTTPCSADPTSRTQNTRVGPVNLAVGFNGHVVKVCDNGSLVQNVIFWSRTNEGGTNIEAVVTTLSGARLPQTTDAANQPNGTNYFNFTTQSGSGASLNCTVIKPPLGISPAALALCET